MIEKSAGAIIFRRENGKIYYLLLKYGYGHWDFPKGNIEKGEKEIDTVRREVFEETGISDLEFVFGFREVIRYTYWKGRQKVYKTVVFYLAETKQKEVRLSYEHKDYAWLEYEDALKRITYDNSKELLRKAHEYLKRLGIVKEEKATS